MRKQFLLNPDGTVPSGVDVNVLTAERILLVVPTPVPSQYGMVAIEQDPQQDSDGTWRQVWVLEPAPVVEETPTVVEEQGTDPLLSLTPEQKAALIALLQNAQ